jgi:hypothetical protein
LTDKCEAPKEVEQQPKPPSNAAALGYQKALIPPDEDAGESNPATAVNLPLPGPRARFPSTEYETAAEIANIAIGQSSLEQRHHRV